MRIKHRRWWDTHLIALVCLTNTLWVSLISYIWSIYSKYTLNMCKYCSASYWVCTLYICVALYSFLQLLLFLSFWMHSNSMPKYYHCHKAILCCAVLILLWCQMHRYGHNFRVSIKFIYFTLTLLKVYCSQFHYTQFYCLHHFLLNFFLTIFFCYVFSST